MPRKVNALFSKRFISPRFVASRLRERGAGWCIKRALALPFMIPYRRVSRSSVGRSIRRSVGLLRWACPALGGPFSRKRLNRRLLMIYDLSSQPFSIGDVLIFQEASLVLRATHDLDKVDFAIVLDPKCPHSRDPSFSSITEDNYTYHLAGILPAAQVNQYLGSLFLFDSHRRLHRFIADNGDLYHVWPKACEFASREYMFYNVYTSLLRTHYNKHGSLPCLSCRPPLIRWARAFSREHVYPDVLVTVNLRNNARFQFERNCNIDAWLEFFEHCMGRYSARFIVICADSEVDHRLRGRPNVLVAKDFRTNIEQDLALIHIAVAHLGSDSGPAAMALFSTKPFLIVNSTLSWLPVPGKIRDGAFFRHFFSNSFQRFAVGRETAELLIAEFARIWEAVNVNAWQESVGTNSSLPDSSLSWLR